MRIMRDPLSTTDTEVDVINELPRWSASNQASAR